LPFRFEWQGVPALAVVAPTAQSATERLGWLAAFDAGLRRLLAESGQRFQTGQPAILGHVAPTAQRRAAVYLGSDRGEGPSLTDHPRDAEVASIQLDVFGIVPVDRLGAAVGADGRGANRADVGFCRGASAPASVRAILGGHRGTSTSSVSAPGLL
jgi:hypothetical protein